MQCPKCGATLKETAIFCNRCGRRIVARPQSAVATQSRQAGQAESPDPTAAAQSSTLRKSVRRGNTPPTPLSLPLVDAQSTQPVPPVAPPLSGDELEMVIAAETLEWPIDAPLPFATTTAPPLPADAVIGERYRVLRFLGSERGDNLYQVHDQLADDRCWACQAPWSAAKNERFCEQCGAARRDNVIALREHLATGNEDLNDTDILFIAGERVYTLAAGVALPAAAPTPPPESLPTEEIPVAPLPDAPPADVVPAHVTPRDVIDEGATAEVPVATADELLPLFFTPEALGLTPQADAGVDAPDDDYHQNDAPTIETRILSAENWSARARVIPHVHVGIASDVGRSRRGRANEDTAVAMVLTHAGETPPPPLTLCVVADGLGGHDDGQRAGRLAARIVTAQIIEHLWLPALQGVAAPEHDGAALGDALTIAIQTANTQILATNIAENCDMGCTITALVAQGDAACIANVGDSRTYHFNGEALRRVTNDHSLVARLVAAGMLAPDDVYIHPQRSQIYRSLGDETEVQVDLFPVTLEPGDTFVLCSDGLWEMVHDPEIAFILTNTRDNLPQNIAEQLINVANDNGGEDNVTVVVAQVVA